MLIMRFKGIIWVIKFPAVLLKTFYHKLNSKKFDRNFQEHIRAVYSDPLFTDESDKFQKHRRKISELASNQGKNRTVLEVAAGAGWQAVSLSNFDFDRVVATDLQKERIDFARKTLRVENIEWMTANITDLSFEDKEFDVSVVSAGLHDLPKEMLSEGVSELARVSRNDVVIFEPTNYPERNFWGEVIGFIGSILDESNHFSDFVKTDLDGLFSKNGFEKDICCGVWSSIMTIKRYRRKV